MTILEGKNICKRYLRKGAGVDALSNVSFALEEGEILGIVGESGSGKSTLLRQISGLETPDSGELLLDGTLQPVRGALPMVIAASENGICDIILPEGNAEEAFRELREKNAPLVSDVVTRHGACGTMKSIYLRDPDGNLVELGFYDDVPEC